jgi:hypothetical protein
MPELSEENRAKTLPILERVRKEILAVAGEDKALIFQMKRYIANVWSSTNVARLRNAENLRIKCGRNNEDCAPCVRKSCRNVVRNLTGSKRLTDIQRKTLNSFAICVIERLKKRAASLKVGLKRLKARFA